VARLAQLDENDGELDEAAFNEGKKRFTDALDNDLNTALAVTALYDVLKLKTNGKTKLALIADFDRVLSVGLIEAAKSFGASNTQIMLRVYLKEAFPAILNGITLTMISLIGYSAMGGAIGAGGLGDVAIRYGYQAYKTEYMIVTSVILILIVQGIQSIGNKLYKKLS
jgi:ABC-type proline/glycine betaine transport system permease subunit